MPSNKYKIIIADSEGLLTERVQALFKKKADVTREQYLNRVLDYFEKDMYDLLLVTSKTYADNSWLGEELFEIIKDRNPETRILFFVEEQDIELAMSALKAGAY